MVSSVTDCLLSNEDSVYEDALLNGKKSSMSSFNFYNTSMPQEYTVRKYFNVMQSQIKCY